MNAKQENKIRSIIADIVMLIFFIVTMCLYTTYFNWKTSDFTWDHVLLSAWNEIANVITIAPVVAFVVGNVTLRNVGTKRDKIIRIIESIFGIILFWFYRVAVILNMNDVIFVLVGCVQYIILFGLKTYQEMKDNSSIVIRQNAIIKEAIDQISNKNILSIQLFLVSHYTGDDSENFTFRCIDHLENTRRNYDYDINCMMVTTLAVPHEDYEAFMAARTAYEYVVKDGSESGKKAFLALVENSKNELIEKLRLLSLEDIEKENCCEARLVLCYSNLECMVHSPAYSVAELEDGELGINEKIDERLFTMTRTGLLGAVLFGKNLRYSFKYNKVGLKAGRQYLATVLDADENSEGNIICLTTIAEKNGESTASDSVFQYIKRCENKITKELKKEKDDE